MQGFGFWWSSKREWHQLIAQAAHGNPSAVQHVISCLFFPTNFLFVINTNNNLQISFLICKGKVKFISIEGPHMFTFKHILKWTEKMKVLNLRNWAYLQWGRNLLWHSLGENKLNIWRKSSLVSKTWNHFYSKLSVKYSFSFYKNFFFNKIIESKKC